VEHPPTLYLALADRIPEPLQALGLTVVLTLLCAFLIGRAVAGGGPIPSARFTPRNVIDVMWEGITALMRETIGPTWPRYVPVVGTVAFAVSEFAALQHQGVKAYLSHLAGPVLWLAPLIFAVELIGHAARMFSLTVRLTGNLFADHTLIGVFLSLPVVAFLVPWAFMGLGLFVAVLQAFIFTFLTITYIGQALEDAHH
jgi:F-type H+-transporting ATPase subunit a